jgi:hypothetical protein
MTTTYVPRHADPLDTYPYDPEDPRERFEMEEVREVLAAMPLDPDALGDGGASDWTLSILFALAGRGDPDTHAYIGPRVEAAAQAILRDIGWPGDAFQGG